VVESSASERDDFKQNLQDDQVGHYQRVQYHDLWLWPLLAAFEECMAETAELEDVSGEHELQDAVHWV